MADFQFVLVNADATPPRTAVQCSAPDIVAATRAVRAEWPPKYHIAACHELHDLLWAVREVEAHRT